MDVRCLPEEDASHFTMRHDDVTLDDYLATVWHSYVALSSCLPENAKARLELLPATQGGKKCFGMFFTFVADVNCEWTATKEQLNGSPA